MITSKVTVGIVIISIIFKCNFAEDLNQDTTKPGDIARKKCKEYAAYVPTSYECPFGSYDEQPLGRSFATLEEFPHTKKEDEDTFWLCTGSLISEKHVVIAAHCLRNARNISPSDQVIRLGTANFNMTEHVQDHEIKEILIHPDYNQYSSVNNIALIELKRAAEINQYVRPPCLFTGKEFDFEQAVASGWTTSDSIFADDDDGSYEALQKAVLEIYTEERCKEIYFPATRRSKDKKVISYETMVCAGTKFIVTRTVVI
ncbi:hypothetical protein NQ318_021458 [Aromia moschata]|uniref:Peptidase S1 domain-containing protein n=1 Tax=Aromia moschata TaxID=1265417 RepID=A0AAV8ZDU9_9CUCU|nr:hypothetical protein NQ318_021458 [Aromia moschata]